MGIKRFETKSIRYYNLKYHFTITFPEWWYKYTVASRPVLHKGEVFISFVFRYGGKTIEYPLLTIIVSPFGAKEWKIRYADSPLVFLTKFKGYSFSYVLPEELPDIFLKLDKSDYDYKRFGKQIGMLKKMITSVPGIVKSFRPTSLYR